MALGEMGMFLPAESAYGTPGAYSQSLRAEATKRASYLSEMDQFYSQLEESKRQFEETMTFREESWEDEMGLRREQMKLERRRAGMEFFLGMYDAKSRRTAATRSGRGEGLDLGRDERLDFLKKIWKEERQDKEKGTPSIPFYGKDYDPYEKSLPYRDNESGPAHYSDWL